MIYQHYFFRNHSIGIDNSDISLVNTWYWIKKKISITYACRACFEEMNAYVNEAAVMHHPLKRVCLSPDRSEQVTSAETHAAAL